MLDGPWLPPFHVDTRSAGLASPDPAIELAVLHYALCWIGDLCRTSTWRGMRPASSWHAPAIVSCQSWKTVRMLSSWFIFLFRTPCSNTPSKMLKHSQIVFIFECSRTRVHWGPPGESMCDISLISCGHEVFCILAKCISIFIHILLYLLSMLQLIALVYLMSIKLLVTIDVHDWRCRVLC